MRELCELCVSDNFHQLPTIPIVAASCSANTDDCGKEAVLQALVARCERLLRLLMALPVVVAPQWRCLGQGNQCGDGSEFDREHCVVDVSML